MARTDQNPGESDRTYVKRLVELLRGRHAMWEADKLIGWAVEETRGYFRAFDETPEYAKCLEMSDRRFLRAFASALGYRMKV